MNNLKFLFLAVGILTVNLILSVCHGGIGLFTAPFALPLITLTIALGIEKINPIYKVITIISLIIFHDLIFRVYSSGNYDQVGETLVQISFLIGVIISLIILISTIILNRNESLYHKLSSVFIYVCIISLYFYSFKNLGPGWRIYNL